MQHYGRQDSSDQAGGDFVRYGVPWPSTWVSRLSAGGGDAACLRIEDDGPGLSEARASEALERGRRLDEAEPGHGLGLAIARDVAELSGAELRLDRSPIGGLRAEVRWART